MITAGLISESGCSVSESLTAKDSRNCASANGNTGHRNSGYCNSGDRNSGNWNSGDENSGRHNTGDNNSGCGNTGSGNSGYYNSGDRNSGDRNSGSRNSGDFNSGWHNTGKYNSGDWNASDRNSGCFMTVSPTIMMFNRPCGWTFEDWSSSDACRIMEECPSGYTDTEWVPSSLMTAEEQTAHPEHHARGGYLRQVEHEADRQAWWDSLRDRDRACVMNLPNFDAAVFYECTGIRTEGETCRRTWWDNLTEEERNAVMNLPNFDADAFHRGTGIETEP